MEVTNPTAEVLRQKFDGRVYEFAPNEIVSLPPEPALFILNKLERRGLVEVKFGDNPNKLRASGLAARARFLRGVLAQHEKANKMQIEKKFPPLVDDEQVRMAKTYLPIYEEYLEKLDPELAARERAEAQDRARKLLEASTLVDEVGDGPEDEGDDIDTLRKQYKAVTGEEPVMAWNQRTLKARIRDAAAQTA